MHGDMTWLWIAIHLPYLFGAAAVAAIALLIWWRVTAERDRGK